MKSLIAGLPVLLASTLAVAEPEKSPMIDLNDQVSGLVCDARYAGAENFTGRPLTGYEKSMCLGTPELALALAKAQEALAPYGLTLVVFDAYRPQSAVDGLIKWAADEKDTLHKADYYPDVQKDRLIPDGYIAAKSGHSRGGTVDLSIADAATGTLLDMATSFDFFGPQSGLSATGLTVQQKANRALLSTVMQAAGFVPYDAEWWHFRLKDEPWPDTYFDIPVR
ncbi:M15 family metallopeptidase [Gimibacter soli]|uniref:D-alanyl-D-alanine dipeptidase n=1 Tax=Gimibacter soli TaxID=3024400 RepID=A0AAF0BLM8_9PROT|nr:M15 family metallopeptidase [Gimibacter soli]WCL53311.1 M15 family metallopeptidase [Gimibacter soli]